VEVAGQETALTSDVATRKLAIRKKSSLDQLLDLVRGRGACHRKDRRAWATVQPDDSCGSELNIKPLKFG
jgi:hypothetical protein